MQPMAITHGNQRSRATLSFRVVLSSNFHPVTDAAKIPALAFVAKRVQLQGVGGDLFPFHSPPIFGTRWPSFGLCSEERNENFSRGHQYYRLCPPVARSLLSAHP